MPLTLDWRSATNLPVRADGLLPSALAGRPAGELARISVPVGNGSEALGDLFRIEGNSEDGTVLFAGDLRSVRGIGRGLGSGTIVIRGDAGAEVGAGMVGGSIEAEGSVGDYAGAEMRGGLLRIRGRAGHSLGSAYPGSRIGMREGVILAGGPIGDDAGLAMRRGLIAVAGPAGNGLGRGMVAGSIFAFGPIGRRAGAGMKRGTIALFGLDDPENPDLLPTFAPSGRFRPHVLEIYLRRLRAWGFPAPEAASSGRVERYNGDRVAGGRGEVLVGSRSAES